MSMSSLTAALFAAFAFVYPLTSQAATLQVDGSGQLLGADGVDVGGVLYDVDFLAGTCSALFNGCDAADDFAFTTEAEAEAAVNALNMQVFVDGPSGSFDSTPDLTSGCDFPSLCVVITPFGIANASNVDAVNLINLQTGVNSISTTVVPRESAQFGSVYASFQISEAAVVPLPATGWLFLSGLAGLFFLNRRRTAA